MRGFRSTSRSHFRPGGPFIGLTAITASPLQGEASNRGRALTVTDPNGDVVVEAMEKKWEGRWEEELGGLVFETADGRWRMEQPGRPVRQSGRVLTTVPSRSGVAILDAAGNTVAAARDGQVVLPSGESLSWQKSGFLIKTRFRLGNDLWVAKGSWRSGRRFSADLSQAMLARDDKALLTGIASILTQHAVRRRSRLAPRALGREF